MPTALVRVRARMVGQDGVGEETQGRGSVQRPCTGGGHALVSYPCFIPPVPINAAASLPDCKNSTANGGVFHTLFHMCFIPCCWSSGLVARGPSTGDVMPTALARVSERMVGQDGVGKRHKAGV